MHKKELHLSHVIAVHTHTHNARMVHMQLATCMFLCVFVRVCILWPAGSGGWASQFTGLMAPFEL